MFKELDNGDGTMRPKEDKMQPEWASQDKEACEQVGVREVHACAHNKPGCNVKSQRSGSKGMKTG